MAATREDEGRVKGLGKAIRSLLNVVDDLERVGNLEQAKRNAESAVQVAQNDQSGAETLADSARANLIDLKTQLGVAQAQKDTIIAQAQDKEIEVLTSARNEAREIVDDAAREATETRAIIANDREQHALFMEDIAHQHEEAQMALDALNVELKALRERVGM